MRVFISWSGELSKSVADLLYKYLPCIIQNIEVFHSEHDIDSGTRWSHRLAKELEETNFGVICLTPDNLKNPWLLFEAGALTKHIASRSCGLLLQGLTNTDVTGPLAQFQNRTFIESEIRKLIQDLNSCLDNKLSDSQLDLLYNKFWPDMEREYNGLVSEYKKSNDRPAKRNTHELVEETLSRIRTLERNAVKDSRKIALISQVLRKSEFQSGYGEVLSRLLERFRGESEKSLPDSFPDEIKCPQCGSPLTKIRYDTWEGDSDGPYPRYEEKLKCNLCDFEE